jgi:GLPGLI family protein
MKNKFLLLIFMLPFCLSAQWGAGVKVEYILQIKKGNRTEVVTVLFSPKKSLGIIPISPTEEPKIKTDENGKMTAQIMFGPNQEENALYHTDYNSRLWTAKLFIADEPFTVTDQLPPLDWTFSGETKTIADYICYAATTTFRGRNYIAYFTPDIPIGAGPYKFGGLPGLILEIATDDGKFAWYCKSISKISPTELKLITPPDNNKAIDFSVFQEKNMAYILRIFENLRNSPTLNVEGEGIIDYDQMLELPEKQ